MRQCSGFSLVEVLVALAIVALALGAAAQTSNALIGAVERQESTLLAQLCAENELAKLRLSRGFPGAGEQSFQCEMGGRKLSASLSIATTPNPNFRRVDARVRSGPGAEDPLAYRISTILARY